MTEHLETIIVNLYGPPGAGKSTTATGIFSKLKLNGVNAEYVPEVAKDFTWEERKKSLTFQIYIHGKQLRNMQRLLGKVDVIVTDSPVILSSFYAKYYGIPVPESFHQLALDTHTEMLQPALHYYMRRTKPYNPVGRNQDEAESDAIGLAQDAWLAGFKRSFQPTILEGGTQATIDQIATWVRAHLRGRKISSARRGTDDFVA